MEYSDSGAKLREKNVYTLHLDTPRMIITGAMILGLLIVSFLLGMTLIHGKSDRGMTAGEVLAESASSDSIIPAAPYSGITAGPVFQGASDTFNPAEELSSVKNETEKKEKFTAEEPVSESVPAGSIVFQGTPAEDILPSYNEPVKEKALQPKAVKKSLKAKQTASAERTAKKTAVKTAAKRQSGKVKAVVYETVNVPVKAVRNVSSADREGFAIQIASYDSMEKATAEAEKLRSMKYGAYVQTSSVEGRQFFRVRVGTMSTREKAAELLAEIKGNSRYSESYIVRQ